MLPYANHTGTYRRTSAIAAAVDHRPWSLPKRPWAIAMQWHDLLFAHWSVYPELIQPLIPKPLTLETFNGRAWLGIVPFMMRGVRPRGIPTVPRFSVFPELNVRTYVTLGGKPGVWFFSLDAAQRLAVRGARLGFRLPYYDARMSCTKQDERIFYESERIHTLAPPARFVAQYQPYGSVYHPAPGTLEHWLTERYCLYAADRQGHAWRGEIHHSPWPLQPAKAEIQHSTMTAPLRLTLPQQPEMLHFVQRLDVVAWWPEPVHD